MRSVSPFHLSASMLFCALVFILSSKSVVAQSNGVRRHLTVNDYFRIKDVNDPQISPNGKWVAYTITTMNADSDKTETRIWMAPTDGSKPFPMTAEGYSASHPRFGPDSQTLAFLASKKKDDKTQVYTLNLHGGDSEPLTHVKQGVENFVWSPDGKRMALIINDPNPNAKAEKEHGPLPKLITRLQFKRDVVGYLDTLRNHIYVFDLSNDSLRQITSGPYRDSDPVWSPDGSKIAFVSNRSADPDHNYDTDIWTVDPNNTDKGVQIDQLTTNPGSDISPAWSPDGKYIVYVTDTQPKLIWYATNDLAIIPASGGKPHLLAPNLDRNVSNPEYTPDGKSVVFNLEDSAELDLAEVSSNGGPVEKTISDNLALYSYSMNPKGTIAALISKPHLPAEVFLDQSGNLARLTHTNDAFLKQIDLAQVENIHYKSKDGTPIEGFMFLPVDYHRGTKCPALLRIHGGPVYQFDFGFNFQSQLFAANGYAVLNVNPRGSSGYGEDFSKAIWADWGHKDYQDVMAGVDYAIKQGVADPNKLGVGGWSYGGILTDHVIVQTNRFKAAITGASEVLYAANYGHDQYQKEWEYELGLPWIKKDRAVYERISPFNEVENIHTPTLVMGGDRDWNVPMQNSDQLYQALKRLGRTTELVVYPGAHHELTRPIYLKDRLERYLAWYGYFVKGDRKSKNPE
ncbi:MAG TPA: S9 family peptidase [Balneolales bacterium]|nr:S9 family peptidase [Balneolales bacterium]